MIAGEKQKFAIESSITIVNENTSIRGIGYFLIYIQGICYGVNEPDSTALACSFDQVQQRIEMRNLHSTPYAKENDPLIIANSFRHAVYDSGQENIYFFGLSHKQFVDMLYENKIVWAPDGDEAFDDGSYILQFDLGDNNVRLIGFKCNDGIECDPQTISDLIIKADEFYNILQQWHDGFIAEWKQRLQVLY
jgi:hypothetical protein